MESDGSEFDTPLFVKVTAEANERLSVLKASLIRGRYRASKQTIITALILAAEQKSLERLHARKPETKGRKR